MFALYNDNPPSALVAGQLLNDSVLEKLKAIDSKVRRRGLEALDPGKSLLVRIGTEVDGEGRVTKNSYGPFNLSWQAEQHPEWPAQIVDEVTAIKNTIQAVHGVKVKFLIWAGMGGSAEDKAMYSAAGLLGKGPRVYILDSTDPAKLKSILEDMLKRSGKPLAETLQSTLVAGMALGMTSYEPVMNLEKLAILYEASGVDSRPNFIYMTLPDSLLDQFGRKQGYRKVEMQLDGGNSTSGRHSAPMTRGSLYPLAFAGVPLESWMRATVLTQDQIDEAWRLSAFLRAQSRAGRNKVTLLLPKSWLGASIWTKQNFEESLGKSEEFGLKIVVNEPVKLANYHSPKASTQDRCFLAVQIKGEAHPDAKKITALRRAGYPVAVVTFEKAELSRYMQFIHYAVFGIGYLEQMNFVTQPGVELYKSITNRLHMQAEKNGGIERTKEWTAMISTPRKAKYSGAVTLRYDALPESVAVQSKDAAEAYAEILRALASDRRIEYGELTFFGDMRYSPKGRAVRKVLERAGEQVFRSGLHMPVDIYEGPAMNHSYHEMIIGHGRCLSTVLVSEKGDELPQARHTPDYHRAQFLATQMALAERGRYVVSITVKDLQADSLTALDEFYRRVARRLKSKRN